MKNEELRIEKWLMLVVFCLLKVYVILVDVAMYYLTIKYALQTYHLDLHYTHTLRNAGKSPRVWGKNIYPETSFSEQSSILTDCVKIK